MVTDPKELASIIARNIATGNITLDEVAHIVCLYIKLYNRLYGERIDAEAFVAQTMRYLSKKMPQ